MIARNLFVILGCLFCLQARASVSRELAANQSALRAMIEKDCPELLMASQDDLKVQTPPLGTPAKRVAIHLLQILLPHLFESAQTKAGAIAATEKLRLLVNQAANEPFSKKYLVLNKGRLIPADNQIKTEITREANRLGSFGFQKLWARVGLGDAYTSFAGADNGKLWNSGLSLVKIYETLYQYVLEQNAYSRWRAVYLEEKREGRHEFSSKIAPTVRIAPSNMKWAAQNEFLLLMDATQLPTGQVVWTEDGHHSAIVGVDPEHGGADLSLRWHWGLPRPNMLRDLSGIAPVYLTESPPLEIEDRSCTADSSKSAQTNLTSSAGAMSRQEWLESTFDCGGDRLLDAIRRARGN